MPQRERKKIRLTDDAPGSDAPIEEWKHWAQRLCQRVEAQENDKATLRRKMSPLKSQLRELNAAVNLRNHLIKELQQKCSRYEAAGLWELLAFWWHGADEDS
jgi:hypothetical protein